MDYIHAHACSKMYDRTVILTFVFILFFIFVLYLLYRLVRQCCANINSNAIGSIISSMA